jgi:trehalose 6-phosphate phosphatase
MMFHILAKRHLRTLAEFAASNVLLGFDYDGTLAPIVADPTAARMRSSTHRLLARVAGCYPCAIISGRARNDLVKRVSDLPIVHLSGNHGLEPWGQHAARRSRVRDWVRVLQEQLEPYRGIAIEDKTYSLTIHYRRARPQREAMAAIQAAVGRLEGARSIGGKYAISLVPRGAPTKGAALERVRRLLACDTAIYVGDDETDEDAFGAGDSGRLLAIRVGAVAESKARYQLSNQGEIDDLLRTLAAFRARGGRGVAPRSAAPRSPRRGLL